MQVDTANHGRSKVVHMKTGHNDKNLVYRYLKSVMHVVYRPVIRPKNAHARVGWSHTIANEALARSMQIGTPVHGRAKLMHVIRRIR